MSSTTGRVGLGATSFAIASALVAIKEVVVVTFVRFAADAVVAAHHVENGGVCLMALLFGDAIATGVSIAMREAAVGPAVQDRLVDRSARRCCSFGDIAESGTCGVTACVHGIG